MIGLVVLIALSLSGPFLCLRIHQPWSSIESRSAKDQRLMDAEMADLINIVYELSWGKAFVQSAGNWTSQPEAARLVSQNTLDKWELLGGRGGKEHLTTGYSFFTSSKRNLCATIFQGTTRKTEEQKHHEYGGFATLYDFSEPDSIVDLCGGITVLFPFGQDLVSIYNPKTDRRDKDGIWNEVDAMAKVLGERCFGSGTRWITAGHSLGSGLATMEAYCKNKRMAERAFRNGHLYSPYSELYLYGSPTFSDGNLVNFYSDTNQPGDACWKGARFISSLDWVSADLGVNGSFDPIAAYAVKLPENIKLRQASHSEYVDAFSADRWQHHPCTCSLPVAVSTVMYNRLANYATNEKLWGSSSQQKMPLSCSYLNKPVQSIVDMGGPEKADSTWHNIINYKCIMGWRGGSLSPAESSQCFELVKTTAFKAVSAGIDGLI